MPSGERYRLTLRGTRIDLSPEQFTLLSKRAIKVPKMIDAVFGQRIGGMIKKGLFRKKNGSFERTKFGTDVHAGITERLNKSKGVA